MYKLKTDSLSSRFYSWIWGTDVTKFKTMCPYFWSYVLTIIFLPLILAGKFLYYITPAKKKIATGFDYVANTKGGKATGEVVQKVINADRFWDTIGNIWKWILIGLLAIQVICLVVMIGIQIYIDYVKVLAVVGGITIFILILSLVFHLFSEYEIWDKIKSFFKLIGNMIYSLYKKVCPLIKWEENVSRTAN